jgi:acetyl esterase/lipase
MREAMLTKLARVTVRSFLKPAHGGAFIIGSPVSHRSITGRLAQHTGANVFVPDYRLAPEYPFPAALEDVLAC